MEARKTVMINGRAYDAVTGLPLGDTAVKSAPTTRPKTTSTAIHGAPQRSTTLNRRATKKPGPAKRPQPGRHMDIARSGSVKRFAPHPTSPIKTASVTTKKSVDIAAKTHPIAAKSYAALAKPRTAPKASTAKQVKDAEIAAQLAQPAIPKKATKKPLTRKMKQFITAGGVMALIIGAGVLAYVQLPSLSVAIAAQQAGVGATYPGYVPTGYSLAQPVTFSDGEVSLRFTGNSGTGEYSVKQSSSSWDSAAVLNNVVRPASGENYIVTQERGLTMYAFEDNAVWVNGGVLYMIESDAALSGDQIRRIATSL